MMGGMRAVILVVAMAASSACSPATWKHVDRTTLAVSTAALLCDGAQTMRASMYGRSDAWEVNPIMGGRPSTSGVMTYFMGAIALNAIAWIVTPDGYRSAVPLGVVGLEAKAVMHNGSQGTGTGWCGI